MVTEKQKIIVVAGPTAVGKTSVAINMAEKFNAEIISSDSMQVYKLMDIGTAKPSMEEQARAKHHLIDEVYPDEHFDAALFAEKAGKAAAEIHMENKLAVVAGGTGLYIKAMLHGLSEATSVDESIAERLKKEAETHGINALHERLADCDPVSYKKLHPNDTQRILRALAVFESSGAPISRHTEEHGFSETRYRVLKIGLTIDREKLYERINMRTELMMKQGFIDEVKSLLDGGYAKDLKSMQSIGYRHIVQYLDNHMDYSTAVETLKRDTRRYAKRQYTWFNPDGEIHWISLDRLGYIDELEDKVHRFLSDT